MIFLWRFIVAALIVFLALAIDWTSTTFLFSDDETQTISTTISIRRPFSSSNRLSESKFSDNWDDDAVYYYYPNDGYYDFDEAIGGTDKMPLESLYFSPTIDAAKVDTKTVIETVDSKQQNRDEIIPITSDTNGGHWEHVYNFAPAYQFSSQVCADTYIDKKDCQKTTANCTTGLMNWVYVGSSGKRYPKFNVDGFRKNMRNSRILFLGSSLIRQQVQALVWTLGHSTIQWNTTLPATKKIFDSCTTGRYCMLDRLSNITICYQFLGSMATKVYREGNYTLDHHKRGHGDSSCMLQDTMTAELNTNFDVLFVQNIAWYAGLPSKLESPTSPATWVTTVVPTLFHDAMGSFLSKVSQRTKTVLVLGQVGMNCKDKYEPETFTQENIPKIFGWNLAPTLWNASISLIQDEVSNVQIVDVRDPVMQSVHAHPYPDCLHLCMNSAAINIYLDKYWVEVFSKYYDGGVRREYQ